MEKKKKKLNLIFEQFLETDVHMCFNPDDQKSKIIIRKTTNVYQKLG